jgi:NADH-quinone oxidoreductase subunit J
VQDEQVLRPSGLLTRFLGPLLAIAFAAIVIGGVRAASGPGSPGRFPRVSPEFGTVRELGLELFTRFYYPFEAISMLLVVAMIGAVLLAKRRL